MDTKYVIAKVKQLMTEHAHTVILHFGSDVEPEDIKKFVLDTNNSIDMEFEKCEMFVCNLVGNELRLEWLVDDIFEIVPKYKNFVNIEIHASTDIAYHMDSIITRIGFSETISPDYIKNIREIVSKVSPDVIEPYQLDQLYDLMEENDYSVVVESVDGKVKVYQRVCGQLGFRESDGYSFAHGTPIFKEIKHKTKERVFISGKQFYDDCIVKI